MRLPVDFGDNTTLVVFEYGTSWHRCIGDNTACDTTLRFHDRAIEDGAIEPRESVCGAAGQAWGRHGRYGSEDGGQFGGCPLSSISLDGISP